MQGSPAMTRLRVCTVLLVSAATFVGASTAAFPAPSGPSDAPADEYTPLVQSVMTTPRWYRDSEGHVRLVYELSVTNGFPVPVTLQSVTVHAADRDDEAIATLEGEELLAATTLMVSPTDPTTEVPPSSIGVVWLDVAVPRERDLPRRVAHTLEVVVPPSVPVPPVITERGAVARVDRRAPVVLGKPLEGPGWVAVGSCCDGPHRRSIQPINGRLFLGQRFAIDWNGVDAENRFVVGDPSRNESWTFYGKPVLAVADATVVKAVDEFPDQVPNAPEPVTIEEADGNHVVLDVGGGRYAFYAHLAPGSVEVEVGDRVRKGDVIGTLGNSGSSTGPHLHFHVMDAPSALASDGMPYVFEAYLVAGRIPTLDDALAEILNAGEPVPVEATSDEVHRRELPLGREIVDFPPFSG